MKRLINLQKIITYEDGINRYGIKEILLEETITPDYAQDLGLKRSEHFHPGRIRIFDKPLFDSENKATIQYDVGNRGVLFLIMRESHYLSGLLTSPYDVEVKLSTNRTNRLVYEFHNLSRENVITVYCVLSPDTKGVISEILLNPDDDGLRQYYVLKAQEDFPKIIAGDRSSSMMMDFKQAISYLKVTQKTLYNYNSIGAIPYIKQDGKIFYKKSDLDFFLADRRTES
ncbi:MAG: helix-turn-helix domain-containing protein [Bacteroidetes bacterium]|nr:helix-turn-helix domain-containing protein [Bacteroidota bacterium]